MKRKKEWDSEPENDEQDNVPLASSVREKMERRGFIKKIRPELASPRKKSPERISRNCFLFFLVVTHLLEKRKKIRKIKEKLQQERKKHRRKRPRIR